MSDELPHTGPQNDNETKVIYYLDEEKTPFLIKIGVPPAKVTLGDFKAALNHPSFKFFFRSVDDDVGEVKEELIDETAKLPNTNGKVVSWLVTAEGSTHGSDGSSAALRRGTSTTQRPMPHNTEFGVAAAAFDQTGMTSDTESTISGLPRFPKHGLKLDRRAYQAQYLPQRNRRPGGAESTMTSDSETQFDTEDNQSRVSSSTDITSVSRQFYRQRKRRKKHRQPSRASSISSITESSMSLNIITVILNMDTVNFLGISIVGQSNQRGDGGIFVANIMKGGAVALDGRIEPGDMILQVNETSFENLSNDDAVQVLRGAVQQPGPIKLVVAKCWDPAPKGYFTIPARQEPVRPIDPGAWVAHTNAMRHNIPNMDGSEGTLTPGGLRPPSVSTCTSHSSGSMMINNERNINMEAERLIDAPQLDTSTLIDVVVKVMARPESGLEIKDRTWLKITIPNAFLGSDVVDWLHTHVTGLGDRRDARKYAARMLKEGYIKHTVNKITFSEQCYYVFGDICANLSNLRINNEFHPQVHSGHPGPMYPTGKPLMVDEGSDHDTVAPLPPPPNMTPTPPAWALPNSRESSGPPGVAPSMVSGYASMPFQYNNDAGSFGSVISVHRNMMAEIQSAASASGSSGSEARAGKVLKKSGIMGPPDIPPKPSSLNPPTPSAPQSIQDANRDLAGSRQSFRMAMGNPCEFFVDVM